MIFMELMLVVQLIGIITIISGLVTTVLSIDVLIRAQKTKNRDLYYFFFCILFASTPWYPSFFGFIIWFFTGEVLTNNFYILIATALIPLALVFWLHIYLNMVIPERSKLIIWLYVILFIVYEYYIFFYLYIHPSAPMKTMLPSINNRTLDTIYVGFPLFCLLAVLGTSVITGIHFSSLAIKEAKNKYIVWKGKILLFSFMLLFFLGLIDAMISNIYVILVVRILLTFNVFGFYIGFIYPKWIRRLSSFFIKKYKNKTKH